MKHLMPITLCLLLPWLSGCAMLHPGNHGVPPAPEAVGLSAQNMALRQEVRKGHGDQSDTFTPLEKAEQAVSDARAQPGVVTHAADELQQAQDALAEAQQLWDKKAGKSDASQLARIATQAHKAKRLAQIAVASTAAAQAQQHLQRLRSRQQQMGGDSAAELSAGEKALIGQKVVPEKLGELHFQTGTVRLADDSEAVVQKLSKLLKDNPNVGVAILAHTDDSEPSEQAMQSFRHANPKLADQDLSHDQLVQAYHMALSNARARSVAVALVQSGIAARRIGAQGYGSRQPADNGMDDERVVALIIAGPDDKDSPLYKARHQ